MPRLSVVSIRLSLVYFGLGFSIGGLLLFHKGVPIHPAIWTLLPAHIEFLLFGWTAQLAIGVAFWILPRFAQEPKRGNVAAAWTALVLLNLGVLLVGGAPFLPGSGEVLLGRLAQAGAAGAFALHAWPRVRAAGR